LRAQITTSQPDRASSRAMALPIPRLPPVTIAFLPSSSSSTGTSFTDTTPCAPIVPQVRHGYYWIGKLLDWETIGLGNYWIGKL
jgi:hypothetical protein